MLGYSRPVGQGDGVCAAEDQEYTASIVGVGARIEGWVQGFHAAKDDARTIVDNSKRTIDGAV